MKYRVTVTRNQGSIILRSSSEPLVFTQINNDPLTLRGLEGGNIYTAVVTAIDEAGNETNFDSTQVHAGPPTLPIFAISAASKSHAIDEESITWILTITHADAVTLTAGHVSFTKSNAADTHVLQATVVCTGTTSCEVNAKVKSGDGSISGITVAAGAATNVLGPSAETSAATSVTIDTTTPVAPVIADASKSFNDSFTTSITQGIPADTNFKEIRYNVSSTDPTCSTGTVYTSSITIPAATTEVRAITCDVIGNISPSSQAVYIFDNTAPAAPSVTSSSAMISSSSVIWSWASSGNGEGIYRYRLDASDLSTGATETTTSSFTGLSLADGNHTLYVQERDNAGNWSTPGSYTVTVDTTPPLAPTIAHASKEFKDEFTTTIDQGSPVDQNFQEFRYNLSESDPTCSTGNIYSSSITIPAVTTTLTVIACDLAGNISASSRSVYTFDNIPPNTPIVTAESSSYGIGTTARFLWTSNGGDGNGSYRYMFDNSDLSMGATETTSMSLSNSSLGIGSRTLYVQERDNAGNWSPSGSFAIQIITPPAAPILVTPTPDVTSLGISWSSVVGATSYDLYWSTSSGVTTTSNEIAGVSSVFNHTGLITGSMYYYRVLAVKDGVLSALSNEVSASPDIVPEAPTAVSATAGNSQVTLTWSTPIGNGGSVISDYVIQRSSNGGTSWVTFNDGNSTANGTVVTDLANGIPYIFRVAAVNPIGMGAYSTNSASATPAGLPGSPLSLAGRAGDTAVELSWEPPASNGGSVITDYVIQYSSDGGFIWTDFSEGVSVSNYTSVIGLTNETAYIFRVAARNDVYSGPDNPSGQGTYSSNSSPMTPSLNSDHYVGAQSLVIGTERAGPYGIIITLQFANGADGVKIWKEKDGNRILNSSGIVANGWQRRLSADGLGFTAIDFTDGIQIGGRVCPPNVFIDHSNMTATGRCVYFDKGNAAQALNKDTGTEGIDWLWGWNSVPSGRGTVSSYYEGNIKTCGAKGMRLPTIYEASIKNPASAAIQLPTGDGITPLWPSSSNGVPSMSSWTWTASANPWQGHYARNRIYHMWKESSGSCDYWGCMDPARADAIRCVLPNSTL